MTTATIDEFHKAFDKWLSDSNIEVLQEDPAQIGESLIFFKGGEINFSAFKIPEGAQDEEEGFEVDGIYPYVSGPGPQLAIWSIKLQKWLEV